MSTTLATLMVGLGYDLSALEKGAPEAFRLINSQTLGMSAEMKRASREGAEAFRTIDEMIGIHINRPMTRLLVETFPQFGKALADVLGGVAFGAVAFAGYEVFERIAKGVEHAEQAEKEFQTSTAKTSEIFSDAMQSFEKADKLRSLSGIGKQLFEIDYSAVEQGRKQVDELAASFEKMLKDEAAAKGFWADVGRLWEEIGHPLITAPTQLRAEDIAKQFAPTLAAFDQLSKLDALKGTHDSAKFISDELLKANNTLNEMNKQRLTGTEEFITNHLPGLVKGLAPESGRLGFSDAEIAQQTHFRDLLLQISDLLQASAKDEKGREADAKAAAAKEAFDKELKSIQEVDAATNHWAETLVKAHAAAVPPKDEFAQFSDSIKDAEIHYTALYNMIGADAFYVRFHASLQQVIADMRELASQKLIAPEAKLPAFTGTGIPGIAPAPTISPVLAGGTTAAQLAAFSNDQAAQLKAAAAAYQELVTPAQKYQLAQQELNLLLEKGLIDQTAYTAGMQKASEAMVEADDHLHKMQEDLQKLLERSTDAAAGMQAFFKQLEIDASENGKFTFQIMTDALHGFNDEVAKAITTGKENWRDYFRSLDDMAIKFFLTKAEGGALQGLKSIIPGATQAQPGAPDESGSGAPAVGGFAGVIGKIFGGGAPSATSTTQQAAITANTAGLTANTSALTALTARMSVPGIGGSDSGQGAGGGSLDSLFPEIPGFASGTDSAPGGFAWVGEQGPELMNVPAGASITPSAAARGGDTHVYQDFRGAMVSEELMRKADFQRAMNAMRPGIIGEAMANFSEVQKRTPKR